MTLTHAVTSTGIAIPLHCPRALDISLRDIAHQLAVTNRLNGAPAFPFSTAQHSLIVSDLALRIDARLALLALLYNAHEAYLGHMTPEVKAATFGASYLKLPNPRAKLEHDLQTAILARFAIDPPSDREAEACGVYDEVAIATAWRDLMPSDEHCPVIAPPAPFAIKPMAWDKAEQKFLEAFDRLSRLAGIRGAA